MVRPTTQINPNPRLFLSERLLFLKHSIFGREFNKQLSNVGILPGHLSDTSDIWLRDFMPVQTASGKFVQFSLTKDYYPAKDRHKRTNPEPICKGLAIDPLIPIYHGKPIYLDGGNVILSPSRKIAIITEKVFVDNNIPKDDLAEILRIMLEVDNVIIIPVEPGDDTGHADGMVRFVDDRTVVANDYSKIDVPLTFKDRFYGALAGSGLDILLVPYAPVNLRVNGLWVALGCYINYLQVGDKVFLPTFDEPKQDEASLKRFSEIFGQSNVIPVPSRKIAMRGGVLNCLSWEMV